MNLEGVVKVEEVLHLIVGYGAVDDGALVGAHNDKGKLDGRVGCWSPRGRLTLTISLNKILKKNFTRFYFKFILSLIFISSLLATFKKSKL